MSTGRPPYFTTEIVDCEFPQDRGALMEDNGSVVESGMHILPLPPFLKKRLSE